MGCEGETRCAGARLERTDGGPGRLNSSSHFRFCLWVQRTSAVVKKSGKFLDQKTAQALSARRLNQQESPSKG